MHWLHRHIETAQKIIDNYNGEMPLQHVLKTYFSANKKHGSRDRKIITHLCYTYYRLGKALLHLSFKERVSIALFLCEDNLQPWRELFTEDILQIHSSDKEKRIETIKHLHADFSVEDIFPFLKETGIDDKTAFAESMLSQPYTFLRIRPGNKDKVLSSLQKNKIAFEVVNDNAVAVAQGAKLNHVVHINKDAVVQDLSSQNVQHFFALIDDRICNVWDCCAASGGKSILAYDFFPEKINLTVSDIRKTILFNLKQRLHEADVPIEKSFQADLTKQIGAEKKFDLLIYDAPCSGSGTWARTPEQMSYFPENKLNEYAGLQKQIFENIVVHLKKDGWLLYITCSVFAKENEAFVDWVQSHYKNLALIKSNYISGYNNGADTMFAALFKKEIK